MCNNYNHINIMTSTSAFVKTSQFTPSSVTYGKAIVDKRGNKRIPILFNGQKLALNTPLMFTWNGANERVSEDSGRVSYDIEPVLQADKAASIAAFKEKMIALEDKILDDAVTYSKEWFGKSKMSRDVAEDKLWPMVKFPRRKDAKGNLTVELDKTKDPRMKFKIPYWEGQFTNISVYELPTQKGQEASPLWLNPDKCRSAKPTVEIPQDDGVTPIDFLPERCYIKCGISCKGIYFSGGKCSIGWTLVDVQVRLPPKRTFTAKSGVEYDSDDDELLNQISRQETAGSDYDGEVEGESKTESPSFSSDGEGDEDKQEEDEEEEEEEEPVVESPPKPKKKKVVRRKKKVASD
jgi:hypothetical protein